MRDSARRGAWRVARAWRDAGCAKGLRCDQMRRRRRRHRLRISRPPLSASATFFRRERELADELTRTRLELEKDAGFDTNAGPDTVCANRTGIDVVGVTQGVALLGALVGGISSRQRKREVEELNEKLRNVNSALRAQARSGVTFAPGLNYAPPPAAPAAPPPAGEQEMSEMRAALKEGRARLKENAGAAAMVPFKKALMLSRQSGDRQAERRAMRGLAVARRQQGDRPGAIQALQAVLEISGALGEHTGDTDALGAIADLYTEMVRPGSISRRSARLLTRF